MDQERVLGWLAQREAHVLVQPKLTNDERIAGIIRYWDEYAKVHDENASESPWQERVGRRLWLGQEDEHLELCRERLAQVKESRVPYELERAAKTYLIRPDAAERPELLAAASNAATRALELAKSDVSSHGYIPWFTMCVGIAKYREGNWTEAEASLSNDLDDPRSTLRTLSLLFRAMARQKLGRIDDARRDLSAASAGIVFPPEDVAGEGSYLGNDVLSCIVVYKEANRLLSESPTAKRAP
jgi:hypothetical protein